MTAILGINDSHCATAALLVDGRILACVSEERFTRKKNQAGYPKRSVEYCLRFLPGGTSGLDAVALAGREALDPDWYERFLRDDAFMDRYLGVHDSGPFHGVSRKVRRLAHRVGLADAHREKRSLSPETRVQGVCAHLEIPPQRVHFVEHHLCHAAAAYFASPFNRESALVFTNDNAGDGVCASVNEAGPEGLRRLSASRSAEGSLGSFYSLVTSYLGMRQLEHEYKVMGLAPYAPEWGRRKSCAVFKEMMELVEEKAPQFRWKVRGRRFRHLMEHLARHRFDWVAAGAQEFLEETLVAWVQLALRGETRVALGGGVFMNVKANKRLSELPEVADLFAMPSCGDESNAIGAAYEHYHEGRLASPADEKPPPIDPLGSLYLGPESSDEEVENFCRQERLEQRYRIRLCEDIETVAAEMLERDGVVARVAGRMEFGARALGNRSILADPRDVRLTHQINRMIKRRDFWLPFAPTILRERTEDYLENPKGLGSPHMMLTFDSRPLGQTALAAAIHPEDGTLRPQILDPGINPRLERLIHAFQSRTGVGAVLNTSFNLSGEPIVNSPQDALDAFDRSHLPHLIVENLLISKKDV